MNIIIQHVETYWTKESRGNPAATIRNAVPESFPVGCNSDVQGALLNEVKYSENSGFKDPTVSRFRAINENQQRQLGFEFTKVNGELSVSKWMYTGHLKRVGLLKPNAWLRVIENERTPGAYTWNYYKHVYNVYFGNTINVNNVLLSQDPTVVFNIERKLL